jgi:hypothetical protein
MHRSYIWLFSTLEPLCGKILYIHYTDTAEFVIPSLPNSSQMITGREAVPFLCSPARMDVLNVQYIYLSLSSPSPEDTPE